MKTAEEIREAAELFYGVLNASNAGELQLELMENMLLRAWVDALIWDGGLEHIEPPSERGSIQAAVEQMRLLETGGRIVRAKQEIEHARA